MRLFNNSGDIDISVKENLIIFIVALRYKSNNMALVILCFLMQKFFDVKYIS